MTQDQGRFGVADRAGGLRPEPRPASQPKALIPSADFLQHLRTVNSARLTAWEDGNAADALFHATELGGEVGEVLNEAKKLHREAMGWRGSRSSVEKLGEEIGDVLICLDKLAAQYGIDLADVTARKFNATSDKVGLPHKLETQGESAS